MWFPDKSKLLKVRLQSEGRDVETAWAEDLGAAPGDRAGARLVRLGNVPFVHAKPTYGDVLVVEPQPDGVLTWDSGGVSYGEILQRIAQDGGRYAMVIDYTLLPSAKDAQSGFTTFDLAGQK